MMQLQRKLRHLKIAKKDHYLKRFIKTFVATAHFLAFRYGLIIQTEIEDTLWYKDHNIWHVEYAKINIVGKLKLSHQMMTLSRLDRN